MTGTHTPGEIRHVKFWRNTGKLDSIGIGAPVCACSRSLSGQPDLQVIPVDRHPAKLNIAKEHHAARSPILQRIWEHVDVHERTPTLPGPDLANLAPCMTEAKRCLACIH